MQNIFILVTTNRKTIWVKGDTIRHTRITMNNSKQACKLRRKIACWQEKFSGVASLGC